MILSVIIVNYQVKYFLELCLHSVEKALQGLDAEILVVDNHSSDGSVEFLRPLFPRVIFIINPENAGFARANNQALEQAKGEYILFLNPDTILPEDFVQSCLKLFLDLPGASPSPRIGGLGVRMIDGSGRFLKESRRGFPNPWVAFCKMSGLVSVFPRSRIFGGYYLGFLPEKGAHPSPVLSGACLWVSRAALDKVGGFDPAFFMYAEDIDLSYRLEKAGYTNYYFGETTIIHFKGESTRKDIGYTRQFYKAMSQFRRKHFSRGLSLTFRLAMKTAIWLRAGLGAIVVGVRSWFRSPATRPVLSTSADRPGPAPPRRRTWVTGDPSAVMTIQKELRIAGERSEASDPIQADEIIFCAGEKFSFRESIMALEILSLRRWRRGSRGSRLSRGSRWRPRRRPQAKFFAAGAHAAVGSVRSDSQGEVWVLK
jgi:N-acetylglucosaminyl-diphospho-decaprenol L-rhamnosyltransferase